jgi:probable rRNA maturation factor
VDPDSKRVRVLVSDGTGRAVRDGGLARWLAAIAPPRAAGEVSVALVGDARMRALNRQYRRKNTSTDVLSFRGDVIPTDSVRISQRSRGPTSFNALGAPPPSAAARASRSRRLKAVARVRAAGAPDVSVLGDIVIATGVARRQAREAGHSYQAELRVLALHGLLHLLGYDHHDSKDNGRMARVEAKLRRKGGLATGLIERASARPRTRGAGA